MDGMRMRTIAGLLALGLALWGPGMPLALAQVEVNYHDPGLVEQCEIAFADLPKDQATECARLLTECQAGSPEEVRTVGTTIEQIQNSADAASQLSVPDPATLASSAQAAGVAQPVALEVAQLASTTLADAQRAFAAGEILRATEMLTRFQEECRIRGVDPTALGTRGELDFTRIACDSTGDFIGKGFECHVAGDLLQKGGIEFQGAPPTPEQAKAIIEGMTNVSDADRQRMFEMAKVYEGYCQGQEGSFAGIMENYREIVYRPYEQAMMEHGGVMTPEIMAKMMAEHGSVMPMGMERGMPMGMTMEMTAMGSSSFTPDMAAMAGGMDPRMFEHYGSTSTSGTTFEAVVSSSGTVEVVSGSGAGPGAAYEDNQAGGCSSGYYHDPSTGQCKLLGT